MKLSERTITVLKNFATMNSGMLIKPGKEQTTFDPETGGILVEAILEESFPEEFAIYDLAIFLGNLTTLKDPELTFTKESVLLDDGSLKLTYIAGSPKLVKVAPAKLSMENPDVTFAIMNDDLQKILKVAAMNNLPNITFEGSGNIVTAKVHDKGIDTSNFGTMKIMELQGENNKDFSATFKTSNFKIIPDNYNIEIDITKFARLENVDKNLVYFIALETE
jgi:hypothetical protein